MKCERCGDALPTGSIGDYYGGHLWALCEPCSEQVNEIVEHAAQGGRVNLVGDNNQGEWCYWIEGNQRMTSVPA